MSKTTKPFFPISVDHLAKIASEIEFTNRLRLLNVAPQRGVKKFKIIQDLVGPDYSFTAEHSRKIDGYVLFDMCSSPLDGFSRELNLLGCLRAGYAEGRLPQAIDVRPIRGTVVVNEHDFMGVVFVQERTKSAMKEEIKPDSDLYRSLSGLNPQTVIDALKQTNLYNAAYLTFNKTGECGFDWLAEHFRGFEFSPKKLGKA